MSVTTYECASIYFPCRSQQNTNSKLLGMDHESPEELHARSSDRTGRKRTRGRGHTSSTQKPLTSSSTNTGLTKTLGGDPPPFNDWTSLARDPSGEAIYMYGGVRSNSQTSTSDFHRLDFDTRNWTNLTVRTPFHSRLLQLVNFYFF
jgi:hypothetical protein